MITAMIVDDDRMALEYLEELIDWESSGFKIVARATDGEAALDLYRKYNPKLIISDVCMPSMDGIELAEIIRKTDRYTRIILLSGYKEVEYVLSAVRLGVDDYILKHELDEDLLTKKLAQVKHDLEVEEYNSQAAFEKFVSEMLINNHPDYPLEDLPNNSIQHMLDRQYQVLILEEDTYLTPLKKYVKMPSRSSDIEEIIKMCFGSSGLQALPVKLEGRRYLVMVGNDSSLSFSGSEKSFSDYAKKLQKILLEQTHKSYSILLMRNQCKPEELKIHYPKLSDAVAVNRFFNTAFCTYLDEVPEDSRCEWVLNRQDVESALEATDMEKLTELMGRAFKKIISHMDWRSMEICCGMCIELLYEKSRGLRNLKNGETFNMFDCRDDKYWFTWSGLSDWIVSQYRAFCEMLRDNRKLRYSGSILKAVLYIQDNYRRFDLSVEEVVRQTGKGRNRFSYLFKKQTGYTIADYITQYRIQKAAELLKSENYKVYEIAEMVGYTTSQYFSRVFRRVTGTSPTEYIKE